MINQVSPYLNFNGNALEAMEFYRSIFGGEFMGGVITFKDMPGGEGMNISEADGEKVAHVCLPVGNHFIMASDTLPGFGAPLQQGNNSYIYVGVDSKEEADRVFGLLAGGGEAEMPIDDVPWGAYFGSCRDKYGIYWMVSYDYPREEE